MAKIIELPKLSPTMEEGRLVRWAKNEGDAVNVDDLLAEVETDKATMEFRSFDKGTLLKRLVVEGSDAKLGQPVAIFGAPGEDISALLGQAGGAAKGDAPRGDTKKPEGGAPRPEAAAKKPEETPTTPPPPPPDAPSAAPARGESTATVRAPAVSVEAVASASARSEKGVAGAILAPSTPRVRRIARERDVDLGAVQGSGEHGRVTEPDLDARPAAPASPALAHGDTVIEASPMRKTIARRLVEAKQTVPHFYLEVDLDVEALAALREQLNAGAAPEAKVSLNDLFIKACAMSLRAVPESNASWVDGRIVRHDRADISMAVAIDDGLVTPVVRDADRLSVGAIAKATRDLATRARARKLKPEEMQGGVFSVSNLGMLQVDRFAAVINPPEGMILAVGAVRDVPVVKAGAVVPGKRCAVTLSCDHRVVDGALGARFLQSLRALVETPIQILR